MHMGCGRIETIRDQPSVPGVRLPKCSGGWGVKEWAVRLGEGGVERGGGRYKGKQRETQHTTPATVRFSSKGGGGGGFRVGKIAASPNVGALCTAAGTTALGRHSGYTKNSFGVHTKPFFGVHRIHKKILFGIRSGIRTDADMQYTGTTTSPQKKSVGRRLRGQDMAGLCRKFWGGGNSGPI